MECAVPTLQMMTRILMSISIVMLANINSEHIQHIMPMQYKFYTYFTEMGHGGRGRFFPGGGDNFLGSALQGEILYLGYSLPRRKFPGGGSVL